MKKIITLLSWLLTTLLLAQQPHPLATQDADAQQRWVDSIYANMSLDQKIGQLFMVSVFSSQKGTKNTERIKTLIRNYHIGGIIFSKGGPQRQAQLTNEYQALSRTPLLISMDAEWGLAMRLDSTFAYPWNMTMGAIKNNDLIRQVGQRIGKHCNALGVHLNFAPDIDINTNPINPIIGNRSFGEDKRNVADKAIAFTQGMQSTYVLANAKHFPGHGDTSQDSHLTLPLIDHSKQRLENIEFYPFRKIISQNVASIMVGHLNVPSLESKEGLPSSLSFHIVTEILKKQLSYNGLIITDALSMKGVADYQPAGQTDLAAFLAGNDILLMPKDLIKGFEAIKEAYQNQKISEERLSHSVKKILMAKYKVGLNNYQPLDKKQINQKLHTLADDLLIERLFENAMTVAQNKKELLPLKNLNSPFAYIKFGNDQGTSFLKTLRTYAKVDYIPTPSLSQLKTYKTVIIGLHKSYKTPWESYKFTKEELALLKEIAKEKEVILTIFTSPYALLDISNLENITSVVVAYQNHPIAQQKAADLIFGGIEGKGVLPVSVHPNLPVNTSVTTPKLDRLAYTLPENVGIDSNKLKAIDSIAQFAIEKKMTPGMQILVARYGKIFYKKNFGTLDYQPNNIVTDSTVYDLASLTKILATLPELMRLYAQNNFDINASLSDLIPKLKQTNKADIKLTNALAHYASLQSWIPFYIKTLDTNKKPSPKYYQTQQDEVFSVTVAKNLYMRKDYVDTIFHHLATSELLKKKRYLYSDLPYYWLKNYIENKENNTLSVLVKKNFYSPMGAYSLTYLPSKHFSPKNIAPTEVDNYFRHQEIRGYVHDQGAAMLGGVAGHAGLFGNALDVAKMMQMFLQEGYYGGRWYLKPEQINTFNKCLFCDENVRRGLGFDKPQLSDDGPTCGCVSMSSFGHTGFTGTMAWADPEKQIVYVFLSNRTYPTADNNLIIRENIRTNIQQAIYNAIMD